VGDSVDELKESMETMGHLGGKDFGFQLNSTQTWVSVMMIHVWMGLRDTQWMDKLRAL